MFKVDYNNFKKKCTEQPFVIVAGNVGAGKSTYTEILSNNLNLKSYYEKVDGNPYLEDFYKNQTMWGFHLQLYFLTQRYEQQREIDTSNTSNIQDRSIFEDAEIFARNLYDIGKMSERDFQVYTSVYKSMIPSLKKPDLMIYLDGSIETIINRIKLRGRDIEQSTDIEYWISLHKKYEQWIKEYTHSPVLYVNIDKVDLVKYPEQIEPLCEQIRRILY